MFSGESGQAKRLKEDVEPATESREPSPPPLIISEALAQFFGTGEREMLQSEALSRVWEYIKANRLEVGSQGIYAVHLIFTDDVCSFTLFFSRVS